MIYKAIKSLGLQGYLSEIVHHDTHGYLLGNSWVFTLILDLHTHNYFPGNSGMSLWSHSPWHSRLSSWKVCVYTLIIYLHTRSYFPWNPGMPFWSSTFTLLAISLGTLGCHSDPLPLHSCSHIESCCGVCVKDHTVQPYRVLLWSLCEGPHSAAL